MSAISIKNIRKAHDDRVILDGISLEIKAGEFVSIVGQSGCGKSTLLNCVAGFLPCDGTITGPKRIGFVFQDHSLYPFMTCRENVALGLAHLQNGQRQKRVAEYMEIIGLPDYGDRYPWQLSGGESQRVAVARAFAPEPDAVLLDEPLSALDMMRRESMLEWLMGFLRNRQTTCLMVTHWIDEAILPADRVVVLGGGTVRAEFAVSLPRPREDHTKTRPEFASLREDIRDCIFKP